MTHYLLMTVMPKELEQLFKMELEQNQFLTKNKDGLCDCHPIAKAHIRELKLFEIDMLETAQNSFEAWLCEWFKPCSPVVQSIAHHILKFFFKTDIPFFKDKIDFKRKQQLNSRNIALLKVNEDTKPNKHDMQCPKCHKRIPLSWL